MITNILTMEPQIDKTRELKANAVLLNDKLHFTGVVDGNIPVSIDYIPPLGDSMGYTSLELFLLSLSSCLGSAILVFLRKMQKTITEFGISSQGIRNEEHPTGFKHINIDIKLKSPDANEDDLKKVLVLAEDKYCPVWAMVKGNVTIAININITN